MIDKRTEASVNYAEILARGPKASSQVEEPAAVAASWNAPSMNMAAAMASLMVASAAKETAPMLTGDTFTAAADFATNKAELAAAENTVASMQPGPQKTAALTVLKNIDRSKPADVKSALNEIMRILEEVKSREVGEYNTLAAREQAAAEREARIRQLREQIDGAYDSFTKEGYTTKEEQEESKDRLDEIEKQRARILELRAIKNPTQAEKQELATLESHFPEKVEQAVEADRAVFNRVERQATEDGRTDVAEQARAAKQSFNSWGENVTASVESSQNSTAMQTLSAESTVPTVPKSENQNASGIQYNPERDGNISHADTLAPSIAITVQTGKDTKIEQPNPNKPASGGISFG